MSLRDELVADRDAPTAYLAVWGAATLAYVTGDGVLTMLLTSVVPAVREGNVVVRSVVDWFGTPGLLGFKAAVVLACLAVSVGWGDADDEPGLYYGPPLVLLVTGVFATVYNLVLVFGA